MTNAPAQPDRPVMRGMEDGAAAILREVSVACAYVASGTALPESGEKAPTVLAQIRLLGGALGGVSQGGRARVGLPAIGSNELQMPSQATRQARIVQAMLARVPTGWEAGAANRTQEKGTVDMGDGLGPRVLVLKPGDRLITQAVHVGGNDGEDAILTVKRVNCDGVWWVCECGA